jgi:hypothetical protein
MNAYFKCLTCGTGFWCRVRDSSYEPYEKNWELTRKDGDMCDHVWNDSGNYEIIEAEPYEV